MGAENVFAGFAAGLGTGVINNMMARDAANISYRRQLGMMEKQNAMNMANARSMPEVQVHGLRMAGFNPAMMNGAGTQVAPTVSQGNADMAQTIPFNAQDALAMAQIANLEAQKENTEANTKKTEAETEIIPTEGEKNVAQTLLYGKQAELTEEEKKKVQEEAQKIANENKTYSDQNEQLKRLGVVMAKDMIESEWYQRLPYQLKGVIESMASGQYDLSIGTIEAIDRMIQTQGNIDERGKNSFVNAVLADVAKKQLVDDDVLYAISHMPEADYDLKQNQASKTLREINKVQKETEKIVSDIVRNGVLNAKDNATVNQLEAQVKHIYKQIEQINENDLGILLKNGRISKAAVLTTLNNMSAIIHTVGMISGGALFQGVNVLKQFLQKFGRGKKDMKEAGDILDELNKKNPDSGGRSTSPMPTPPTRSKLPGSTPGTIRDNTLGYRSSGVSSFRFT